MKRQAKLTTERVDLTTAIAHLETYRKECPQDRIPLVDMEIARYNAGLVAIERELEVIDLNEQWHKDHVYSVPQKDRLIERKAI